MAIFGTVTDATGAIVLGAKVTATNQATNVAKSAETNSSGAFSIANLAPGVYRVVMEGWDPLESTCRHASLSIL